MSATRAADETSTWLKLADAPAIAGLRFRRPRGDDADYSALAQVMAASNRHDQIPYLPTAAHLREEFEGASRFEQTTDVVLAEVDGVPVANAGIERVLREGIPSYEIWGHVDPGWRRRGIGSALLHENLRRVAELGALEPGGVGFNIRSHAGESEVGQRRLLEAAGFETIRWFFLMRRSLLDDIPHAPLPEGLDIRPVQPDQHRRIWEADNEAFRDHWQANDPEEADFTRLFAQQDLDTSLWVVAWDGEDVAGVVQPWIWKDENRELDVARGWLEHISVRRPWRRRGVGRALTAEALHRLRAAAMTEAMLGVDAENPTGALAVYESLGFEVHRRSMAYQRPPAP